MERAPNENLRISTYTLFVIVQSGNQDYVGRIWDFDPVTYRPRTDGPGPFVRAESSFVNGPVAGLLWEGPLTELNGIGPEDGPYALTFNVAGAVAMPRGGSADAVLLSVTARRNAGGNFMGVIGGPSNQPTETGKEYGTYTFGSRTDTADPNGQYFRQPEGTRIEYEVTGCLDQLEPTPSPTVTPTTVPTGGPTGSTPNAPTSAP